MRFGTVPIVPLCDAYDLLDIDELHRGIHRSLEVEHARLGRNCIVQSIRIVEIDPGYLDVIPGEPVLEEGVRAAVQHFVGYDFAAAAEENATNGRDSGHSG